MLISVGAPGADQAGGAAGATATGTDGMGIFYVCSKWFSVPYFPCHTGDCVFLMFPTLNLVYTMQSTLMAKICRSQES